MSQSADKFLQVRITARDDFADDLWMIRVDPGSEFKFAAGQYATLGVPNEKGLVERAYSIVSAPHEPELEFFFELVPQGELTPLIYKLRPGDTLTARKVAKGRFTLDTTTGRTHHLLLCTVTGIAPFVSFARGLLTDWKEGRFKGEHRLYVVHGASLSREFGYRDEMERIAAEVPWLTYVPTVSRPWDDPEWTGETGRVDDSDSQVRRPVGARHEHDDRVSLRPPGDGRARQSHPAPPRLEERGAEGRGLLPAEARHYRIKEFRRWFAVRVSR